MAAASRRSDAGGARRSGVANPQSAQGNGRGVDVNHGGIDDRSQH
jgi:hypothetical protein